MKKFLCSLVAVALVMGLAGMAAAGDNKDENKAKPEVKKEKPAKAQADKPKKERQTPEQRLTALDADKSKDLSKAEFCAGKEGKALERAEKMFSHKDKDGDGKLTLVEFTPAKKEAKPKKEGKPAEKKTEKKPEAKEKKEEKAAN